MKDERNAFLDFRFMVSDQSPKTKDQFFHLSSLIPHPSSFLLPLPAYRLLHKLDSPEIIGQVFVEHVRIGQSEVTIHAPPVTP
jgi:hypothetical protein